ncbi:MAG: DAK2 domain-containing protein [Clostridia bacterium]|nr:DAK2 domain-containing protein [Clostridia bacterium]
MRRKNKDNLDGSLFAKMARGGAAELVSNADEVNRLNVFPVPDGDTGDNMRLTIESGIAAIENLNSDNLAEVMRVLSHGMLLGARGNSGVILSQFFAGVAEEFKNSKEADVYALGEALRSGVRRAYGTVMTPTEGTILTVAREAVECATSAITPKTTIKSFFAKLVDEMYASLERTPDILPALKAAGVVDSGGAGLFYIMDGFRRVLDGEEIDKTLKKQSKSNSSVSSFGPESKMTFSYCTELLLQLLFAKCDISDFDLDEFKRYVSRLGDSVCTVKSGSIIKLHVHTYTPEAVIAYAREFGELISVKIENMSIQHTEQSEQRKTNKDTDETDNEAFRQQLFSKSTDTSSTQKKKYGVIAVAFGDGLTKLFYSLGADRVIYCGQCQAPSARDFLDAINGISAEHVFIFPNNSNVILAAVQAAKLCSSASVHVVETKSIGAGYAALASLEFDNPNIESVKRAIENAIASISCGHVSPAVRDAEIDGVKIKKGDTVGFIERRIILSRSSLHSAAFETAQKLLLGRSHLTVFLGAEPTEKDAEKLLNKINKRCPDTEVFSYFGGQDIYPYIFVAK